MKTKLKKLFRNPVFNIGLIGALTGLVLWLTLKDNGDQVIHMLVHANKLVLVCIALFMLLERWIHAYGLKLQCNISTPRYTHFQDLLTAIQLHFLIILRLVLPEDSLYSCLSSENRE